MQELIETIRVAIASDATAEQKSTGAQACRTILAALASEPGKPIVLPGTPLPTPASRVSVDQMLDLMIARLTTIAAEREAEPPPTAPPPRGLRVPAATAALPRALARPTKPSKPNARKP
jgi:hypothetical protein